jgi:hypothetical protein
MGTRAEMARSEILTSWKDIARHLGKSVRTVQRWESELGLPVRRPQGVNHKSSVVARRADLDAWLAREWSPKTQESDSAVPVDAERRPMLDFNTLIRTSHSLRTANHALVREISIVLRALVENCNLLNERQIYTSNFNDPLISPDFAEITSDRPVEKASI